MVNDFPPVAGEPIWTHPTFRNRNSPINGKKAPSLSQVKTLACFYSTCVDHTKQ